jgi:uncharacterized phiE125 gp8 family phage protein
LAEVKSTLAVSGADDDVMLTQMIEAATAAYDGPDGALGRCLISQTYRWTLDRFLIAEHRLPLAPHIAVSSVAYVDPTGATVTLDPSKYRVSGLGATSGARIAPALNTSWPETARVPDAVEMTFVAGFGATAADVPHDIRRLILGTVGSLYLQRESTLISQMRPVAMPDYDAVIDRWRAPWFAV